MSDEVQATTTSSPAPTPSGGSDISTPTPSSVERPVHEEASHAADSTSLGSGNLDTAIEQALARAGIGKQEEQVAAVDTTQAQAATPAETTTPASADTELAQLKEQLSKYQAELEPINEVGGLAAVQADIAFTNTFTAPNFDGLALARQMVALSKDNYISFVWGEVARHENDIANYLLSKPEYVERALAADPGYKEYLNLKEQGFDPATYQEEQADLSTPEGQRFSALQKEHAALKAQVEKYNTDLQAGRMSELEERTLQTYKNYDNEQLKWVSDQVANLKWGDEYKNELEFVVERTQTKFNQNPTAQDALIRARHFAAQGPVGEAQKERWTKVVRSQLAKTLADVVQPFNRLISAERKYIELTRQKQAGTINVPGAAATEQKLAGTPKPTTDNRDFDARIEARLTAFANSVNAPKNLFVK